ncbi:hypothetical protein K1719_006530 [Acacia pycnantha]|nr:hypothetical protein K1719_006530 [Acacia pycnantha]
MMKTRNFQKVDLPEDLMMEIMVRLPVKSLLQFKYVSKSWYVIITNPYFTAKQVEWSNSIINKNRHSKVIFEISPSREPAYISMISYGEKIRDLELPFLDNNADLVIVCDQCNGILCLSSHSHFILWNPATKEAKAIPERGLSYFSGVIGFGFDPITKDYKIVRLLCEEKDSIEVYSLSSDCWRTIYVDNAPYRLRANGGWNSYLNGFYHWLGSSKRDDTYILSFDFSKEVLGVIKLPLEVSSSTESVGVLGGSLACAGVSQYGNFEIWVMNEYGVENSWTKKFQNESNRNFVRMLGLLKENEILVEEAFKRLISYNLQNQRRKRFRKRSLPLQEVTSMFQYVESLVPLTTNKGKRKI